MKWGKLTSTGETVESRREEHLWSRTEGKERGAKKGQCPETPEKVEPNPQESTGGNNRSVTRKGQKDRGERENLDL